jgi:hypothetical protein
MRARRSGLLTFAFIILLAISAVNTSGLIPNTITLGADASFATAAELPPLERDWSIQIVFVGYDAAIINESLFLESVPSWQERNYTEVSVRHNLNYDFLYANQSYEDDLKTLMMSNSLNGSATGTWLNETSLEQIRDGLVPNSPIFEARAGRGIDASSVESWLSENPIQPASEKSWTLYLLNFSEADSGDHSLEHWYTHDTVDADSGLAVDWFMNPSGNILDDGLEHQFIGVGGSHNFYLLDPSADQWYLKWARIWHNDTKSEWPLYFTEDIEDVTSRWDLEDDEGKNNMTAYLAEYGMGIITGLFAPSTNENQGNLSPPSFFFNNPLAINLELHVFTVDADVTPESIDWVTTAEDIHFALSTALPFKLWNVTVIFDRLSDDTAWSILFSANSATYGSLALVDGSALVEDIEEAFDLGERFAEINLMGGVFLKRDIIMNTEHGNETGSSHQSAFAICETLGNIYSSSESVRRKGLTGTILREVLSILGLNASSETGIFVADFVPSVMNGMSRSSRLSFFESSTLSTIYLDELESDLRDEFYFRNNSIPENALSRTYMASDRAVRSFIQADSMILNHQYSAAYEQLLLARDWIQRLWWSTSDGLRPEISAWGLEGNYSHGHNFTVWADVIDAKSGIENVSAVVLNPFNKEAKYLMSYNGSTWAVEVPGFIHNGTYRIQVVSYDWGMNVASTYFEIIEYSSSGPFILDPTATMPLVIATSVAAMVIVSILALMFDKKYRR